MKYTYQIEDGQFSRHLVMDKLVGQEGDIIEIDDEGEEIKIYILYIQDELVHCIGNIEREFPKGIDEHESMKTNIISMLQDLEFLIHYYDREGNMCDTPLLILAKNKEEARNAFKIDYPGFENIQGRIDQIMEHILAFNHSISKRVKEITDNSTILWLEKYKASKKYSDYYSTLDSLGSEIGFGFYVEVTGEDKFIPCIKFYPNNIFSSEPELIRLLGRDSAYKKLRDCYSYLAKEYLYKLIDLGIERYMKLE